MLPVHFTPFLCASRAEGGCTESYSRADLALVRCYICNRMGHLCCAKGPQEAPQPSCHNCGDAGHRASDCHIAKPTQARVPGLVIVICSLAFHPVAPEIHHVCIRSVTQSFTHSLTLFVFHPCMHSNIALCLLSFMHGRSSRYG